MKSYGPPTQSERSSTALQATTVLSITSNHPLTASGATRNALATQPHLG